MSRWAPSSLQVAARRGRAFWAAPPKGGAMLSRLLLVWRWLRGRRNYLTAEDDPVLARLWDNEEDAVYDDL